MQTTLQERCAGCAPATGRSIALVGKRQPARNASTFDSLQAGIKQAYATIQSLGRYTPNQHSIYRVMLFLGAAATAAQGYLLLPAVTDSQDNNRKGDAYLDRDY